jgi:outer membrane protein, heavy metal efflux system
MCGPSRVSSVSPHHRYGIALMISAALCVPGRPVQAQGDSLRLSRTEAQERALGRSGELIRRAAARAEARRLGRVRYPHNPEVSVEVEGAPSPWSNREYTRRVRFEQEIDLRGEGRGRSRIGQATGAVADRELGERSQAIAAQVDEVYSRHLVARRKAAFLEPLRDRARSLRARAEGARRRETLTGFESRLLRAEALGLEADWLEAERELDVSDAELRTWLVVPSDSALDLEDDLDERPWRCDPGSALALALQGRLALARAAAAESLALARVMLELRLARVNPAFGVSVGRERLELEPQGLGMIGDEDTFVGLELRVPIPIFARNQPGIAEARLDLERARAERAALDRDVRQEVAAGCAALQRAEDARRIRREAAESAGQDLRLIESAYGEGRIPLDEYLTLRERLVRQQLALLDAVRTVEQERARLVLATGTLRPELTHRWVEER